MKKYILFLVVIACSCTESRKDNAAAMSDSPALKQMLQQYYNERMQLFPLEATANGDSTYNNLLPADFTDSYRAKLKDFFTNYSAKIAAFNRDRLNDNDKKSFDIFSYEMKMQLEGLSLGFMASSALADNVYMPFDQFNGLPLLLGQMGSGSGNQPFATLKDYTNWLQRGNAFAAWADSAIVYFRKGMKMNYVLPHAIVVKMIPQMKAMLTDSVQKSLFYEPLNKFPAGIADEDRQTLIKEYSTMIKEVIIPSYGKLAAFLEKEYLPASRNSTGVNALPGGDKYYAYMVRYWTTTHKTPEEIYNTGLAEVERIHAAMEQIKQQVGFKGDLPAFFEFMKTNKQFMPFTTAEQVLDAFRNIQKRIDPNLKKMFGVVPKTRFEIRETEAFREASASAEYYPGLPDNSRPGIFYVPIIDPTTFNITSGMESLFLHEAIPGHHYQMSLQSENTNLPAFRKFIWYGAYGEGYALYCESLGKELGLYTDSYQHMGALGDEILRAIRLVVDVGMHTGKMTREEAIKYMMDNMAMSEEGAVAEIERYMVFPGQALSYKTGALKIRELRDKYAKELGNKFNLAAFHDEFLKNGCMPLEVIERSLDEWAERNK